MRTMIRVIGVACVCALLGCAASVGGGWRSTSGELEIGNLHYFTVQNDGSDGYKMGVMGDVTHRGSAIDFTPTHVNECWCMDWSRQWAHLDDTDIDDDYDGPEEFESFDPLRVTPFTVTVVSSDEGLTLEYPGGAQEEFAFIGNSADVVDDGYEEELADSPATDEPCDTHGDGSPWDCGPLA